MQIHSMERAREGVHVYKREGGSMGVYGSVQTIQNLYLNMKLYFSAVCHL